MAACNNVLCQLAGVHVAGCPAGASERDIEAPSASSSAKCRVCDQTFRDPSHRADDRIVFSRNPSPVDKTICVGCWTTGIELEKFLVRAADRTVMGDWTAGWLREIIRDPARYR
jgi:hypothetical protein